jgi:hypothetical protein
MVIGTRLVPFARGAINGPARYAGVISMRMPPSNLPMSPTAVRSAALRGVAFAHRRCRTTSPMRLELRASYART